jgi:hypothetical protein
LQHVQHAQTQPRHSVAASCGTPDYNIGFGSGLQYSRSGAQQKRVRLREFGTEETVTEEQMYWLQPQPLADRQHASHLKSTAIERINTITAPLGFIL